MIRKLYTKRGDEGFTKDFSGNKIPKDDQIVVVNGKIDLLQSAIDSALLQAGENKQILEKVQEKLWQTAGEVSRADESLLKNKISEQDLEELEKFTDLLGEPPTKFIRFNTEEAIILNECRVRCRELEIYLTKLLRDNKLRPIVYKYVNRLSSLFFMMAYKRVN